MKGRFHEAPYFRTHGARWKLPSLKKSLTFIQAQSGVAAFFIGAKACPNCIDSSRNDQHFCFQFNRKESGQSVFVDDGRNAGEMIALPDNRDTTATTTNDDCVEVDHFLNHW